MQKLTLQLDLFVTEIESCETLCNLKLNLKIEFEVYLIPEKINNLSLAFVPFIVYVLFTLSLLTQFRF